MIYRLRPFQPPAFGLAVACLLACASPTEAGSLAVLARIDVMQQGNMRTFIAQAQSTTPAQVDYQLRSTVRKAGGGQSVTNQAGRVSLQAGRLQALSRASLRIDPGDRFCVALTITKGGAVVARRVAASEGAKDKC